MLKLGMKPASCMERHSQIGNRAWRNDILMTSEMIMYSLTKRHSMGQECLTIPAFTWRHTIPAQDAWLLWLGKRAEVRGDSLKSSQSVPLRQEKYQPFGRSSGYMFFRT